MTKPAPGEDVTPNAANTLWDAGDGEFNQLRSGLDSIADDLVEASKKDFARITTLRDKIEAAIKELEDDIKALGGQTVLTSQTMRSQPARVPRSMPSTERPPSRSIPAVSH